MSDRSTKVTYQDMTILARKDQFYIMRAPVDIAEEIAHLQATGAATFSLALRPLEDQRQVDATALGETTTKIIQKYGLPIPQAIVPGFRPAPTATPAPSGAERRSDRERRPVRQRGPARPRGPRAPVGRTLRLPRPLTAVRRRNRGRVPAGHPYEVTMPDRSNPAAPTPTLRTDAAPHAPRGA